MNILHQTLICLGLLLIVFSIDVDRRGTYHKNYSKYRFIAKKDLLKIRIQLSGKIRTLDKELNLRRSH